MFRRHLRSKTGLTHSNPFCLRLVQHESRDVLAANLTIQGVPARVFAQIVFVIRFWQKS